MARHLSSGAAPTPTSAAGVLEAVDAGARAALLLDPVLPSNRHAQEEHEDEEGQTEDKPDDPETESEYDARLFRIQRVFADAFVDHYGADNRKEQVHYE